MSQAILNELMAVLDEDAALAIINHRTAKPTKKPFDLYRAKLTVATIKRSLDRNATITAMLYGSANKKNLTVDYLRAVIHYDPETGAFTRRETGERCESKHLAGYLTIAVAGRSYLAHRVAWFYVHGGWPVHQIDHRDRDRTNNRLDNLRPATNQQNCWNMSLPKHNSTGVKGVHVERRTGKFVATIRVDGKTKYLGRFPTLEEAAAVYRAVERTHRGDFLGRAA